MKSRRAEKMMIGFGNRLRAARQVVGYANGADFATDLRIDTARYRRYERGESLPPIDVLFDICQVVRKSADFLLFGTTDRTALRGPLPDED